MSKESLHIGKIEITNEKLAEMLFIADEMLNDKDELKIKIREDFAEIFKDDIDNAIKRGRV